LLYTDQHEWIRWEEGVGVVGITDYAQNELGDIVFVELPDVGTSVVCGKPFGTIEAVKTVADLFAPASGEVVEVNGMLEHDASQVNTDPYGEGWMIKIRVTGASELDALLSAEGYRRLIGEDEK
jgi:glycine cleavage system H protein